MLAQARGAQADVLEAEARKLAAAVAWARLHEVTDPGLAATWGDSPITLGGEGVPLIATGCVAEFAAAIGTTTNGGRSYLADALELAYRLPELYARIQAGTLPTWKGRRIAGETTVLPPEAAAELDARIAPIAAKLSARATQQLIDETIATVLPEHAQEMADRWSTLKVVVDHRQVSFVGTSSIYGALDLADALDLDQRLTQDAEALKAAGCEASLDARRAMALGRLARGETTSTVTGRPVTLYVHLPAESTNPTAVVENGGDRLLTQAQVAAWCGNPGVTVTLKPVIDPCASSSSRAYVVPDRIKEQIELRDRTCVFPHCHRPARACQKDHIEPFDGTNTESANLGNLCQHHHNLKTHTPWTYTTVARAEEGGLRPSRSDPGVFLWRSPHGHTYLRDRHGTQDLTLRPVAPPGH